MIGLLRIELRRCVESLHTYCGLAVFICARLR